MKTTNELDIALRRKTLKKQYPTESHVVYDGLEYTITNSEEIFVKSIFKRHTDYFGTYHIILDEKNCDNIDIIGIIITSKHIGALCHMLELTHKRFFRDYGWNMFLGWLGTMEDNDETRKSIQFYNNDKRNILDSLLRNPHLDEDESIAYIKKASEIGFLITNFSPNGNCYHQFAKNRTIRILKELILKMNLNEAIQNVLKNEIEKKILEGENEQHL